MILVIIGRERRLKWAGWVSGMWTEKERVEAVQEIESAHPPG